MVLSHSMTDTTVTRTTAGKAMLASLESAHTISVFSGYDGELPILDDTQKEALKSKADSGNEHHVVAYLQPILQALLLRGDVLPQALVNSEYLEWLLKTDLKVKLDKRQLSSPLKPDLFVSYLAFCRLRSRSTDVQSDDAGSLFGVLSSRALHNDACVLGILEAKKGALTDGDFGDLVSFLMCFSYNTWGMLFSEEEFWLCYAQIGTPVRVVKAKWTTPGTKRMLQEFVATNTATPPLAALLQTALTAHSLELHTIETSAGKCCHLGSGATGHVFAVRRIGAAAGAPLALKVSVRSPHLAAEFTALQKAADASAPVLPVEPKSFASVEGTQWGFYLMQSVGERCPVKRTLWLCKAAFTALHRLHAAGYFHGDARLANLLLKPAVGAAEREAVWIDMANGFTAGELDASQVLKYRREDASCLAASLLSAEELPEAMRPFVRAYDIGVPDSVAQLVSEVWNAAKELCLV